jgi:dihydroorotate dehydrogenase electron transfer subunit
LTENTIQTVKIKKIVKECKGVITIIINVNTTSIIQTERTPIPGQFIMVWVPGVDEIPMSLSGCDKEGNWKITVKNVGECTNALHKLNQGDYIGVRGPLGNGFNPPHSNIENIFIIGGGVGIAPLRWLTYELQSINKEIIIIEGAKRREELVFFEESNITNVFNSKILYCTDDGSFGQEEFASNLFENVIRDYSNQQLSNSIAYTCGPEIMMHKVFKICEKNDIELEASLERVMRCGCGLCGLCALDPTGLLVCKDGPVFNSEQLRKIEDFGHYCRDFTGKKVVLD